MVRMLVNGDNMNIEISSSAYWKKLNYYDGKLYLSLLVIEGKNDWRMMTFEEVNNIRANYYEDGVLVLANETIYVDEHKKWCYMLDKNYLVVPVRDV
jgi:hypothetical protein